MDYTPVGSYEILEKCSICETQIEVGEQILRDKKTRKIICKTCIKEITKIA